MNYSNTPESSKSSAIYISTIFSFYTSYLPSLPPLPHRRSQTLRNFRKGVVEFQKIFYPDGVTLSHQRKSIFQSSLRIIQTDHSTRRQTPKCRRLSTIKQHRGATEQSADFATKKVPNKCRPNFLRQTVFSPAPYF